ncbi:hypothetical protein [Caulobacter sp. RHG1]|uniref:hypothetical protein n=1 Tax=Caulobacter sp. (strain RHG1) TaxID=2545762 RepID=UPI0015561F75|nr:hypothetical protein [Caulobacter sp. RHG1]NQE62619.1 hypothetical protein [Caulobacter sp. RHG1]
MSRFACPSWTVAPVNQALISAVMDFADIYRDMGGGRTLRRISHERAARADMFLLLGRDVERVTDIGLVWNDREDQIVRVTDDAELRESRLTLWEEAFDLFETEETDDVAEPMRLVA